MRDQLLLSEAKLEASAPLPPLGDSLPRKGIYNKIIIVSLLFSPHSGEKTLVGHWPGKLVVVHVAQP